MTEPLTPAALAELKALEKKSNDGEVEMCEFIFALRNAAPALIRAAKDRVPVEIHGIDGLGVCECGEDTSGPNYCGHCGRSIKWED